MPNYILYAWETAVNKAAKTCLFYGGYILVRKTEKQIENYIINYMALFVLEKNKPAKIIVDAEKVGKGRG